VDRSTVQRWLDDYIAAWRANERAPILALFSEDVVYRFHPFGDAVHGSGAVADAWLESPDDPATWDAHYEPWAIDGRRAVAVGTSHYHATEGKEERMYHNVYLLEFDGQGRCSSFTELYMREQ
jgi:ketosteroid isomerase-like protein